MLPIAPVVPFTSTMISYPSLVAMKSNGCFLLTSLVAYPAALICVPITMALRLGASTTAIFHLPFNQFGRRICALFGRGCRVTFCISRAVDRFHMQANGTCDFVGPSRSARWVLPLRRFQERAPRHPTSKNLLKPPPCGNMTFRCDGEPLGEPEGRIRYAARGAVMDMLVWLRSLGLAEYETAFRENKIDEGVLPKLTAEDLKELGVSALGDRRKLLDAIAALRTDAGVKAPSVEPATPKQQETAERRQVTVMFSDLVGSTALSARMDPEDLREVISAYHKCAAETVRRFGGFVAQYMGDGVLVYFGYPQAHEDDAERAVRAGLELVAAVSALKTHRPCKLVSALRRDLSSSVT